ncbi:MAG: HEPN domain-containing protein, partial [Bacteroidia bacterium]
MPSNSYINFLRIKEDVSNLVSNFHFFNWVNTADEEPNHLVRSAILMLCAAWERYNEDLLLESIDFLCQNFSEMNQLNLDVKKHISIKVKQAKNEIKPIELSG